VRVRIGTDRVTGKARGFAFAQFTDPARAADAIRRFDAFELRGRRLRVNDADDKPPARAPRVASPAPLTAEAFVPPPDSAPFNQRKGGSRRGLRARKRSLRWAR